MIIGTFNKHIEKNTGTALLLDSACLFGSVKQDYSGVTGTST